MDSLLRWLDARREWGPLFVRLVVGMHLMWNTADNVFSWARMLEFRDFLAQQGFPVPLACAVVSAYAQFLCGALFLLGALTRPAALVMAFNFVVALLMVHVGQPEQANFPALMMLGAALFLLFHGPGDFAVDAASSRRRTKHRGDPA
jgi:putative oxidoreductase